MLCVCVPSRSTNTYEMNGIVLLGNQSNDGEESMCAKKLFLDSFFAIGWRRIKQIGTQEGPWKAVLIRRFGIWSGFLPFFFCAALAVLNNLWLGIYPNKLGKLG